MMIDSILKNAVEAHISGQLNDAEKHYHEAIKLDQQNFFALYLLGEIAKKNGDQTTAIAYKKRASQSNLAQATHYFAVAKVLTKLEAYQEAIECFNHAIHLRPHFIDAYCEKGNAYRDLGQAHIAILSYDSAIKIKPSSSLAHLSKAFLLIQVNEFNKAISSLECWLTEIKKSHSELQHPNKSAPSLDVIREYLEIIISVYPKNADAFFLLGNIYSMLYQTEKAIIYYEQAVSLQPDMAVANYNLANYLLQTEQFAKGWELYEWRWKLAQHKQSRLDFTQPEWSPSNKDAVVLVWGEQGLGDHIIYANLLTDLAKNCKQIILAVDPRLITIFASSFPKIKVIPKKLSQIMQEKFDYQIPMASLGKHFRTKVTDFTKNRKPYLRLKSKLPASILNQIPGNQKLICGLSWLSIGPGVASDKSIKLHQLLKVFQLPQFHFIDLQYTNTEKERDKIKDEHNLSVHKIEEINNFHDIENFANLINECDIVLTISNTTAHLAGALGKKVILMLPRRNGLMWYWFENRPDSLWYPNVKVFRQSKDGEWADVLEKVYLELASYEK